MSGPPVPAPLALNAVQVWGEAGRQWLSDLPDLVEAVAQEWQLRVGAPFELSFHWVAPAVLSDGSRAVVKLGVPGSQHLRQQADALRAFDGDGAVRLLGQAFGDYLERFHDSGPLPRSLVEQARSLFLDLCASASERTLLHGDLHHDNVLDAGTRGWLAIDPHGWVGDPGFDAGAMLYNPMHPAAPGGLIDLVPARVEQLADGLGLSVERTRAWGFAMAVLSEVWTCEDGAPPEGPPLGVAELLRPLL